MKTSLTSCLAAGALAACVSGASAAELVARWDDFSDLTSGPYTLSLSGSSSVSDDGALNVVGASGGTANIDLTDAGLTLNTGLTVSFTMSHITGHTSSASTAGGVLALATDNSNNANAPFTFLIGPAARSTSSVGAAFNGGQGNITVTNVAGTSISGLFTETPHIVTVTLDATDGMAFYLDGSLVATGTLKADALATVGADSLIDQLTFGSFAGGSSLGTLSETVYDLSIYKGAMTAEEVKALVPEPATATLGLLALAGLAARRRRK